MAIRTCSVCGVRDEKTLLTRLVSLDGVITIDDTGTILGRGAYLCGDENAESIERSLDKISRALRIEIESGDWKSHFISLGIKSESGIVG